MSDDLMRKLECEKCHEELSIPKHPRGDFSEDVYLLRSGVRIPLFKKVGICMSCNKFVWMERFPSHAEVLEQLAKFQKKIEDFRGGDTWWGQPLFNFYSEVVQHKAEWLNLLASRNHPVCLSCGSTLRTPAVWRREASQNIIYAKSRHTGESGHIFVNFAQAVAHPKISDNPLKLLADLLEARKGDPTALSVLVVSLKADSNLLSLLPVFEHLESLLGDQEAAIALLLDWASKRKLSCVRLSRRSLKLLESCISPLSKVSVEASQYSKALAPPCLRHAAKTSGTLFSPRHERSLRTKRAPTLVSSTGLGIASLVRWQRTKTEGVPR